MTREIFKFFWRGLTVLAQDKCDRGGLDERWPRSHGPQKIKRPGKDFPGPIPPTLLLYEQPKLSPQFKHLKHAPLRTATWPQLGQVGASFIRCSTASFSDLISR